MLGEMKKLLKNKVEKKKKLLNNKLQKMMVDKAQKDHDTLLTDMNIAS